MAALVFLLSVFIQLSAAALPHGWKTCKLSDSNHNECYRTEMEKAIRTLKDGDRKLDIPPLEPLVIEKLVIKQGSGALTLTLTLMNMEVHGLTDGQILSYINNDWKQSKSVAYFNKVVAKGKYKAEGRILSLPINGEGMSTITMSGLTTNTTHDYGFEERNRKRYIKSLKLIVDMTPKNVVCNIENLFNGNKELGDNMNKFLNDNWEVIWVELKDPISRVLGAALGSITNRVFQKIPANDIIVK